MKKIELLLGIALVALLALGCEGPSGPPGPPGLNGLDGLDGQDALSAEVYEQNLSFTFDPDFNTWSSDVISFNDALNGDVYLGYVSLGDGLFTSLPASFFDEFGEFQYVFDHDFDSVQFQIIGDNDLSDLSTDFTDGITTRIAIIPAELFSESDLNNGLDIISLMQKMNIDETDIILQ